MNQPAHTTALQPAQDCPSIPVRIDAEQLIAKAIDKNLPVEALERLLAMRERLKMESAREAFHAALSAFQASCPVIPKDRTALVQSQRGSYSYQYADLATIGRTIGPRLNDCRLSFRFDTEFKEDPPALIVRAIISHAEGHSEVSEFRSPIDAGARMNVIQQSGSALTYGKRYALCNALGILTGEDDTDGNGARASASASAASRPSAPPPKTLPETINKSQVQRLGALIRNLGLDAERVKSWCQAKWGVERAEDLTFEQWKTLVGVNEEPGKLHAFREAQDKEPLTPEHIAQITEALDDTDVNLEAVCAALGQDLSDLSQGRWGEVKAVVSRLVRSARERQWAALPEAERKEREMKMQASFHAAESAAGRSSSRGT